MTNTNYYLTEKLVRYLTVVSADHLHACRNLTGSSWTLRDDSGRGLMVGTLRECLVRMNEGVEQPRFGDNGVRIPAEHILEALTFRDGGKVYEVYPADPDYGGGWRIAIPRTTVEHHVDSLTQALASLALELP